VKENDPFSPENLRVTIPESSKPGNLTPSKRQKREQKQFTKVPWSWRHQLRKAKRASTFKLALFLLHRYWQNGGKPVPVSIWAMEEKDISSRQRCRALAELETLGLIMIERRKGVSPIVTPML
jgi:hypothetical protein